MSDDLRKVVFKQATEPVTLQEIAAALEPLTPQEIAAALLPTPLGQSNVHPDYRGVIDTTPERAGHDSMSSSLAGPVIVPLNLRF